MSSTNRSEARKSHKSDYYVTPHKDVELFCEEVQKELGLIFNSKVILDPCAGGCEKYDMSYPTALNKYPVKDIITSDIREDSRAEYKCNYLKTDIKELMRGEYNRPDIIITNPPFNKAVEIIEKAIDDVADDGYVIMLLRLNFFGAKCRFDFWGRQMPTHCFVHHERIGFIPTAPKNTDSIEYAHMVWKKGEYPDHTKLKVI
jgi:hypothetical protein